MKIVYTKHAESKFSFLKELGWNFSKRQINKILKTPHKTQSGHKGTKVVLRRIDKNHNLRIIYAKQNDIITVITFYPVEKGRYD